MNDQELDRRLREVLRNLAEPTDNDGLYPDGTYECPEPLDDIIQNRHGRTR